jgi:hypothetical protein
MRPDAPRIPALKGWLLSAILVQLSAVRDDTHNHVSRSERLRTIQTLASIDSTMPPDTIERD